MDIRMRRPLIGNFWLWCFAIVLILIFFNNIATAGERMDRFIDHVIKKVTPDAGDDSVRTTREATKWMLDPNQKRADEHFEKMKESLRKEMDSNGGSNSVPSTTRKMSVGQPHSGPTYPLAPKPQIVPNCPSSSSDGYCIFGEKYLHTCGKCGGKGIVKSDSVKSLGFKVSSSLIRHNDRCPKCDGKGKVVSIKSKKIARSEYTTYLKMNERCVAYSESSKEQTSSRSRPCNSQKQSIGRVEKVFKSHNFIIIKLNPGASVAPGQEMACYDPNCVPVRLSVNRLKGDMLSAQAVGNLSGDIHGSQVYLNPIP